MKMIHIATRAGSFAEDKDIAREIRLKDIMPHLKNNGILIINFAGVETATQSFIHALISDAMRKFGTDILDTLRFKNCNESVTRIINIVVDYMQIID